MAFKIRCEKVDECATTLVPFKTVAGEPLYPGNLPIEIIVPERLLSVDLLKAFIALMVQGKLDEEVTLTSETTKDYIVTAHTEHVT